MKQWMVYGANGYTGRLIAEEATRRGLAPILAGRNEKAVRELAETLGLPWRVFDLDNVEAVRRGLAEVSLVLHCAGPFSATSRPMVDACMAVAADYLDITGEIGVFESVHGRTEAIAAAGITAIPGVGFDVVPSDCLAAMLKEAHPDADTLKLAMKWVKGRYSPGTAKTMVEGLAEGGCIRRDGRLQRVPSAWKVADIPFQADKSSLAVTIPWGDVSTAYYSTGIPDIEFYMGTWPAQVRQMKLSRYLGPVLGLRPVQNFFKKQVEKRITGPDAHARDQGHILLWGEASGKGRAVAMRMRCPEGYKTTVLTALEAVGRVLEGGISKGALTPSKAFGAAFAAGIDGVEVTPCEPAHIEGRLA